VLLWARKGAALEALGAFMSDAGDWNNDGFGDVMTWVQQGDGMLRIYSPATRQMLFEYAYTQASGKITDDWGKFFRRVGDVDADGVEDYAIGVQFDDHDGVDSGRVDLVTGRDFRVLYRFYPGYDKGGFGRGLASGQDLDGDGIKDLAISAPYQRYSIPKSGKVFVYALNDLYLQAEPMAPVVGDTVVVDLRAGPPGLLGMVVLTDASGTPLFAPLLVAPFDVNGELQLSADVDASLSGLDFTLLGLSQNRKGRGPLMDSLRVTVSIQ